MFGHKKEDYRGSTVGKKYHQNLHISGNKIYSYSTVVAEIHGTELWELGKWSVTTSKHVNYICNHFGLKKVKKY
jgi:hypothetical protein